MSTTYMIIVVTDSDLADYTSADCVPRQLRKLGSRRETVLDCTSLAAAESLSDRLDADDRVVEYYGEPVSQ